MCVSQVNFSFAADLDELKNTIAESDSYSVNIDINWIVGCIVFLLRITIVLSLPQYIKMDELSMETLRRIEQNDDSRLLLYLGSEEYDEEVGFNSNAPLTFLASVHSSGVILILHN